MEFRDVKSEVCDGQLDADYLETTEDHLMTCCLCPEGILLQDVLVEHLQQCSSQYPCSEEEDFNDFISALECCNCKEGQKLQAAFLNHLLSHITLKKSNSKIAKEEILGYHEIAAVDLQFSGHSKRKKPSYHKKYNRRERSPATEKIQREFTFDPIDKLYICNFCRNGYKHKQTAERHLSKEHDLRQSVTLIDGGDEQCVSLESEDKKFCCGVCNKAFKLKQSAQRHLAKEHNLVVPKKIRTRKGNTSQMLKLTANQTKRSKDLTCDLCGHSFHFRESLRKHLLRHLEPINESSCIKPVREKIVCDQCSKLVQPGLMKRHFRVHHSDYRPFKCDEPGCETSFFEISKFNDHKNIHLKVKPYICEFCQESFHYASNWRQHKLRHTQPDRFKCPTCSNCFVSTKSLRLHMRLHTDIDPTAPKPFACDFEGCNKSFRYLDRLKLHMNNVHRAESEHNCELCSFVTHKKKYFNRHMQKVHQIQQGHPRSRVFPTTYENKL